MDSGAFFIPNSEILVRKCSIQFKAVLTIAHLNLVIVY